MNTQFDPSPSLFSRRGSAIAVSQSSASENGNSSRCSPPINKKPKPHPLFSSFQLFGISRPRLPALSEAEGARRSSALRNEGWAVFPLFLLYLLSSSFLSAATPGPDSPNHGLTLTEESTPGQFNLSWWGQSGYYYFVEEWVPSGWEILPIPYEGENAVLLHPLESSDDFHSYRLRFTDDLESFIPNYFPELPSGEGLDWWMWQIEHFGVIGVDPDADADGDGLSNWQEFLIGSNPVVADTNADGVKDGSHFFSGLSPTRFNKGELLTLMSILE